LLTRVAPAGLGRPFGGLVDEADDHWVLRDLRVPELAQYRVRQHREAQRAIPETVIRRLPERGLPWGALGSCFDEGEREVPVAMHAMERGDGDRRHVDTRVHLGGVQRPDLRRDVRGKERGLLDE